MHMKLPRFEQPRLVACVSLVYVCCAVCVCVRARVRVLCVCVSIWHLASV